MEDIWIPPAIRKIPQWVEDQDVWDGIHTMLKQDWCLEEQHQLSIKVDNLCWWYGNELAAVELGCSFFSLNIDFDISWCSVPRLLKAWQGLAHAVDAQPNPKPCSDSSTFAQSLACSLLIQNLHWSLCKPYMELSCALDTLMSTCLCDTSPSSHHNPCGLLHLQPSALSSDDWEEPVMTPCDQGCWTWWICSGRQSQQMNATLVDQIWRNTQHQ